MSCTFWVNPPESGGGGGGGLTLSTWTATTEMLNGDSNGDGPRFEDFDMEVDSNFIMVVNVAARRVNGTGSNPAISVAWYPTSDRSNSLDGRPLLGSSFAGAAVPTGGGWAYGPGVDISGSIVPMPSLPRDESGTETIYLRVQNAAFGSHPDDDAAFEVVIHYVNLDVTLPV